MNLCGIPRRWKRVFGYAKPCLAHKMRAQIAHVLEQIGSTGVRGDCLGSLDEFIGNEGVDIAGEASCARDRICLGEERLRHVYGDWLTASDGWRAARPPPPNESATMHLTLALLCGAATAIALPSQETFKKPKVPTSLPVVFWHGMGDTYDGHGLQQIADIINETYPGTFIHSVYMDEDPSGDRRAGFIGHLDDQVRALSIGLSGEDCHGVRPVGGDPGVTFWLRCHGIQPRRAIFEVQKAQGRVLWILMALKGIRGTM